MTGRTRSFWFTRGGRTWLASFVLLALAAPQPARAQLPAARLDAIVPAGGQAGSEFKVTVRGADLDAAETIRFTHQGITAAPLVAEPSPFQKTPRPIPGRFLVKIDGNVPPGMYEARVVGRFGMSNPRAFLVGGLEEMAPDKTANRPEDATPIPVGTTVNGQVEGGNIDFYQLSLKQNQPVLIDCWGERIDSRIDATLVLYDSSGQELRRVRDTEHRDPILHFLPPSDGPYTLAVHDFTYGGGADYFYRLTVHSGPHVEFVFPPVGEPGSSGQYKIYGRNLPGGKPVPEMSSGGQPLEELVQQIALPADQQQVCQLPLVPMMQPHATVMDGFEYRLDSPAGLSNSVLIRYASAPVVVEASDNDTAEQAQPISTPCVYVGQFYPDGDRDWISFEAKQGDEFFVELFSHRLGLETDPHLLIEKVKQQDNGQVQVSTVAEIDEPKYEGNNNTRSAFDLRTRDPSYRLVADEDAVYRILIRDLYGSSGPRPQRVYKLDIRRPDPDFRLVAYARGQTDKNQMLVQAPMLRRGGTTAINVQICRLHGFDGEVNVTAGGLPAGVTCGGATLGGGVNRAMLVFRADDNAASWSGPIKIVGTAKVADREVTRYARGGALIWNADQKSPVPRSRMTHGLGLSVIDSESAPATVEVGDGQLVETCRGAKLEMPIKLTRRGDFKGEIKLTATGVPQEMKPKDVTVKGDNAKLEFALTNQNLKPGSYTFALQGTTKFKYQRDPEALKKAEEALKEIEQIAQEMAAAAKQTAQQLKDAQAAANNDRDNAGLADAAQQADQASRQAQDNQKKADQMKREAEQALKNAKDNSKPKDVNLTLLSMPIRIRVAATPIKMALANTQLTIKQGENVEIPVSIDKKFGFDENVEISFQPPANSSGISAQKLTIPKGQTAGKLKLQVNAAGTPGEHTAEIRANLSFNNVRLESKEPIALKVEKVEKQAQK